jgi:5S rRNA maturation endonuclease (ribonuclease M5)
LKCFAGCTLESIMGTLGLKLADLFPPRTGNGADPKGRIVATYDYTDEAGKLLFQCVRYEPKDFKQRRPDPQRPGTWVWNLKDTRRVLYRLPDVLAGLKKGRTAFIVEGEKDANALAGAGFVATCNPMGSGKWLPEHTETLRGAKRVVVIPDKDEPGRRHAQAVASSLQAVAKKVVLIELPDRAGHAVKDTADWFCAGGTAEELKAIVETAPEFTPTSEPRPCKADSVASEYRSGDSGDDETIARLAALPPLEYERQREKEAEQLGCRASILDKLVDGKRPKPETADGELQGRTMSLADVELWPEPVSGAGVLNEIAASFVRYVVLPPGAADALALWTAHTHTFKSFICSPRLNITSPEKCCGKTTLRDVLGVLVPRPLATENLSTAVLFRVIEAHRPTVLADECDSWLRDNEELRGLLNSGHRRGGQALRCEGESNEVRAFAVFAPAVLCGIGSLPGTLQDRSIIIRLERAKPDELRERFDSRHTEREQELCRKLARFGSDHLERLAACDPTLPSRAFNRLADNWRPLFAVAEIAGGDWPQRAATAFAKLMAKEDADTQGIGTMLLADIWQVFQEACAVRMFSKSIVEQLCAMTDRPWPEAHHGKPITETWLARRLRSFGIAPRNTRNGMEQAKGYAAEDFVEVFERYLPAPPLSKRPSVPTTENIDVSSLIEASQAGTVGRMENTVAANKDGAWDAGTDGKPPTGEETKVDPQEMLL